ncbi:MAG: hypothetical protein Q7U08_07455 [Flavobacteriaceae bacterium]|nr:hypothetical protein [Flavobacteriaceae bacterium]
MRKKIETELKSLATEILQLPEFTDVVTLRQKSLELYEKLTLLKFVDNYFETRFEDVEISFSPSKIEEEQEEINHKQADLEDEFFNEKDDFPNNESVEFNAEEEAFIDETVNFLNYPNKQLSLEEELANSISADIATDLFEKSVRVESKSVSFETKSVSLNDKLQNSAIQVGLNDRIAFVKYLFNGSQEDYNRVLSQLNSFDTEDDAKDFLLNIVKPDYYWDDKFEYEQRFLFLIERKFL